MRVKDEKKGSELNEQGKKGWKLKGIFLFTWEGSIQLPYKEAQTRLLKNEQPCEVRSSQSPRVAIRATLAEVSVMCMKPSWMYQPQLSSGRHHVEHEDHPAKPCWLQNCQK